MTNQISATIIKDSKDGIGNRITTVKMVIPRIILAELNTHRIFNRNSASSRAIPFRKMVKSVMDNPFIPIAFQKDHSGMQGSEYLDPNIKYPFKRFKDILENVFKYEPTYIEKVINNDVKGGNIFNILYNLINTSVTHKEMTLVEWWLYCRDRAVESAIIMASLGVTKQLCNRILEPFAYHTVLVTATEWENFFNLRNPKYTLGLNEFKSKQDALEAVSDDPDYYAKLSSMSELDWLKLNSGMGEIHIMDLAEKVWDVMKASTPKLLAEGEWHLPYIDNDTIEAILQYVVKPVGGHPEDDSRELERIWLDDVDATLLKISTARCARLSYETLGDNPVINYEKDLELYNLLLESGHMSPFEHTAKCMTNYEYLNHIKGVIMSDPTNTSEPLDSDGNFNVEVTDIGWSRNLRGFIQFREIVEIK